MEILIKREVGTRNWGIAVIGLTILCLEKQGVWVKKAVECFQYCLMGHASRALEGSGAERV